MGNLLAMALFGTAAATILYGWIFNNTKGSVLLTLIAHATDGLVRTGNLGWTEVDSSRFFVVLIAVWCVTALVVVILTGWNLTRLSTAQRIVHPSLHP